MNKQELLTLKNEVQELSQLADFLEQLGQRWSLAPKVMMAVNLSLEEAVSNILFYAYEDAEEHFIELKFQLFENRLIILLSD
ncbi:MAG: ATP-binding protein, partial [Bacteroidia bacterium]|nr:ATP-binding protein [Bacteroidia bacterium]